MKHSFKALLKRKSPLLVPGVYDSLSAKLAETAGFLALGIGGFALAGVRYGLPDVGIISFGELYEGVRDILVGREVPVLVDGDDGYGDVKNVTRTVQMYEQLGAGGIVLEDQQSPKRCGHMTGKQVIQATEAALKLEAAVAARSDSDFFIVARTDAAAVYGIDDAIDRGRLYAKCGVDAVFVEAPTSIDDLKKIGDSFDIPLLVNMAENGRTPILPPCELYKLGFSIIVYPSTLLIRQISAIQEGLSMIQSGDLKLPENAVDFAELTSLFGIEDWAEIDRKFTRHH